MRTSAGVVGRAVAGALLVAAVGAAGGALAAGDVPTRAATTESEAEALHVVLDEYLFGPTDATAPAGTVRLLLENVGIRRHNIVVLVDGAEVASPYLRPGETTVWELTLERPGTYRFWCAEYRHLEKGMHGTLTVE